MIATLQRIATRWWLILVLLGTSTEAAFALAITNATLSLSDLTIGSSSGTVSVSNLMTCASVTGVFNSLGQSAGNSNPPGCAAFFNMGTTNVSTSAAVAFAQGNSQAFASLTGGVTASSAVNIPTGIVQAGVTLDGSLADLVGSFSIVGASTNPVTLSFSVNELGSLDGVSDLLGALQTDDVTASLTIFGTPDGSDIVLFDYETLTFLPSIPGVANYPATMVPISQTLSGFLTGLDPTKTYTFDLEVNAESQAMNTPEPGSPALLLLGVVTLAGWQASNRRRAPQEEA